MKNKLLVPMLFLLSTQSGFAAIDCSSFYKQVDGFIDDMNQLATSAPQISPTKQNKLESLWFRANNGQNLDDRRAAGNELYRDVDYEQFDFLRMLGFLVRDVKSMQEKGGWLAERKLLDLQISGKLNRANNGFGNNPFANIKKYSEISRDLAMRVTDFNRYAVTWKANGRGFSPNKIQYFEMRSTDYLFLFSNIASCNLSYLDDGIK